MQVSSTPSSVDDDSSYADASFEEASGDECDHAGGVEQHQRQGNQSTAVALPATPRRQCSVVPLGVAAATGGPPSRRGSPHARQQAWQASAAPAPSRLLSKARSEQSLDQAGIRTLSYDHLHQALEDVFPTYDDLIQLKNQFKDTLPAGELAMRLAAQSVRRPNDDNSMEALIANLHTILGALNRDETEAIIAARHGMVDKCIPTFFKQAKGKSFLKEWIEEARVTGRPQGLVVLHQSFMGVVVKTIDNLPTPNIEESHYQAEAFGEYWVSASQRRAQNYPAMKRASIAESTTGDGSTGWKVHIAVNERIPGNLAAAYNAAVRLAHEYGITGLKVLRSGKGLMNAIWEEQRGKQITLYFGSTELVRAFNGVIVRFFIELAQELHDLNVVMLAPSRADQSFGGPFAAFSYRHDQDRDGNYVSATLDPAVIAQLRPPQQAAAAVVSRANLKAQPQPARQPVAQTAIISSNDSKIAEAKTTGLRS